MLQDLVKPVYKHRSQVGDKLRALTFRPLHPEFYADRPQTRAPTAGGGRAPLGLALSPEAGSSLGEFEPLPHACVEGACGGQGSGTAG